MKRNYYLFFKRFIDFNLALLGLILLSPFLLIVIILQIIFNGFPIFFIQDRVGKDEKIFKLFKFRTMSNKNDVFGIKLPDRYRKTWFGSFLRMTSIDELPSLINVLKGDMALIGPRPLLVEYLNLYNNIQKKRHQVRPGLTGLAQVNGRNELTWFKKFEFDIYYVDRVSLIVDFSIFFKTIVVVLTGRGVNQSTSHTAEKFNGSN
jgi:lipopolysaccharide/colanic/teichoic acid biosynthesis glycosyltransferase